MRKVTKRKVTKYFLELTCRKCGVQETFTMDRKNENCIPTHGWNSWVLGLGYGKTYRKTELCVHCYAALQANPLRRKSRR